MLTLCSNGWIKATNKPIGITSNTSMKQNEVEYKFRGTCCGVEWMSVELETSRCWNCNQPILWTSISTPLHLVQDIARPDKSFQAGLEALEATGVKLTNTHFEADPARKSAEDYCSDCKLDRLARESEARKSVEDEKYYCNGADQSCPGNEKCVGHRMSRGIWSSLSKPPEPTPAWEKAFDIWSKQGRTEEQKWAVVNFLTGAGANLLKEVERTAEERGFDKCLSIRGIELSVKAIKTKARAEERKRIV
jgi:hypothetical protein